MPSLTFMSPNAVTLRVKASVGEGPYVVPGWGKGTEVDEWLPSPSLHPKGSQRVPPASQVGLASTWPRPFLGCCYVFCPTPSLSLLPSITSPGAGQLCPPRSPQHSPEEPHSARDWVSTPSTWPS